MVSMMMNNNDLTSCVVNNCLYVGDYFYIYKIELRGDNQVFQMANETAPAGHTGHRTLNKRCV
jgi:hypothetical protein